MTFKRPLTAAVLALALSSGLAHAEGTLDALRRLCREAEAAIAAKDLPVAEDRLVTAGKIYPNDPGVLARLVTVQALRDEKEAALKTLDAYAALGLILNMDRPERAALRAEPGFPPIGDKLAANARPAGRVGWTAAVDAAPPLEGVAWDPDRSRIFVSLVGGRAILVGDRKAGFKPLTREADHLAGILGMAYDRAKKVLWAAETSGEEFPNSTGPAGTAILAVDAGTGALKARFAVKADGANHQFGDVALGPDGTVYATDSAGGGVYRLKPGGAAPEEFARSGDVGSPQGMVIVDDGRAMILADYPTGLHRVDLASGAITPLPQPAGVCLAGLDGLTRRSDSIYATQNGVSPARILRLRLDAGATRVTSVEVVASALPEADDIALGTVIGDEFVFSAQSGWAAVDAHGKIAGEPKKPVLAGIALPPQ